MTTNDNTDPPWTSEQGSPPAKMDMGDRPFSMVNGYIRLHRSLLKWEWYDDDAVKCLFLHLLLTVNWKPGRWRGQVIPSGAIVTSMDNLAKEMGWNRSKLRRTLDKLKSSHEVTTKAANKWTVVSLDNWAKYQLDGQQSGQQDDEISTSERPISGHNRIKKESKKKEENGAAPPRMTFDKFREECRAVHAAVKILSTDEAKAFFEYWTEGHTTGKGRWQAEKFFDIARRMGTWAYRAKVAPNGKPVPMTKAEANAKLEEYRAANGIAPGGVVETHKIPADIYAALK